MGQGDSNKDHNHNVTLNHNHSHTISWNGSSLAKHGHSHDQGILVADIGSVDNDVGSLGFLASNHHIAGSGNRATYTIYGARSRSGVASHRNHNTDVVGSTGGNSGGAASTAFKGGVSRYTGSVGTTHEGDESRPLNVTFNTYIKID